MAAETAVTSGWIEDFRCASDEDAELQAHGRYYSCAYLLDMEEHSYLVQMHAGKVEEILEDPGPLDDRYQFIIRASAETWAVGSGRRRRLRCTTASSRPRSGRT